MLISMTRTQPSLFRFFLAFFIICLIYRISLFFSTSEMHTLFGTQERFFLGLGLINDIMTGMLLTSLLYGIQRYGKTFITHPLIRTTLLYTLLLICSVIFCTHRKLLITLDTGLTIP